MTLKEQRYLWGSLAACHFLRAGLYQLTGVRLLDGSATLDVIVLDSLGVELLLDSPLQFLPTSLPFPRTDLHPPLSALRGFHGIMATDRA